MAGIIKVLSIDGGGIRGIIPAMVLAEIERRTDRPIAVTFDLIAGTSAGGILALALTAPGADGRPKYAAEELIEFFEEEGPRMFPRRSTPAAGSLKGRSDSESMEEVFEEYFQDLTLRDALTPVFVSSYDITRDFAFFFRRHAARISEGENFLMKDVARATSATPSYVKPAKVGKHLGGAGNVTRTLALVDGAVFASNPAMCAYIEARKIYFEEIDFLVVSLGTGELVRNLSYDEVRDWGLSEELSSIMKVTFEGINQTVDYQLRELLPSEGNARRYYRFQTRLVNASDAMDDASAKNVSNLKLAGEDTIRLNANLLTALCELLSRDAKRRDKL